MQQKAHYMGILLKIVNLQIISFHFNIWIEMQTLAWLHNRYLLSQNLTLKYALKRHNIKYKVQLTATKEPSKICFPREADWAGKRICLKMVGGKIYTLMLQTKIWIISDITLLELCRYVQ